MKDTTSHQKARFEIIGHNVADIGARLTLTNRLIRGGVEWGSVENIGNNTILVKLGGTKEEIERYKKLIEEKFEEWLIEDIDEEERVKKRIGNPGIHYTSLIYDNGLLILPIDRHTHALQCQQLRKGINVFEEINITFKELRGINEDLNKTQKALLKILEKRP